MGLWLKQGDDIVPVGGGGGGDAGGDLTWPLPAPEGTRFAPSYSFALDKFTGLYLAAAGDMRVAVDGSDVIGFDDRFITLGGQQTGVGRMSILSGSSGSPVYGFEGDIGTGIYRADSGVIGVSAGGVERLRVGASSTFAGDLQVDGLIYGQLGPVPDDFWTTHSNGIVFTGHGMVSGSQGSYRQSITCNGYRNTDNKWTSIETGGNVGATVIELTPNGGFHVLAASNYPTGSTAQPPMRFQVTETTTTIWNTFNPAGGTTFGITEGIDTQDVLDRAETATMPAIDEEGVATADVKGVMLNDVVTALLAKVKELSATVADQTEKIAALEGVG